LILTKIGVFKLKIISLFNNKGGVGKSTLSFHIAHALAEKGIKTLMIDLDPQSNLTLQCMPPNELERIWKEELPFIEDFQDALTSSNLSFDEFIKTPRSIHCLLKPIEDGVYESSSIGAVYKINENLGLIPGSLSLHTYEDKLAKNWSDAFMGEPQAIRLITSIRNICNEAAREFQYEIAILDTSPSLGILNRIIISTSTGFFVPCMPDMFSTFGIINIGQALKDWKKQFDTMYSLLPDKKRKSFPSNFVKFLGFTIYNAKKYEGQNEYNLATAHYSYVREMPNIIRKYIPSDCYKHLSNDLIGIPIGRTSVMHSHNTLPAMSQKYNQPIWKIPELENLEPNVKGTISGNRNSYFSKRDAYREFVTDLLNRLEGVED